MEVKIACKYCKINGALQKLDVCSNLTVYKLKDMK